MTYFVDIFSIETFEEFSASSKSTAGFAENRRAYVSKIKPGDKIVCYLKGLSCWVGLLEVTGPMRDATGSATGDSLADRYPLQFSVKQVVWLPRGELIPIKRADVWAALSFTKGVSPGSGGWSARLRSSGGTLPDLDGQALEQLLLNQAASPKGDNITDKDWDSHRSIQVPVTPDPDISSTTELTVGVRTSHKMQALLADIGMAMGFQIWIPAADRVAVASEMRNGSALLTVLPAARFPDQATLKTVEQIDVLWLTRNTVARAFEVEHTTAVYSGILRMADLLALQPNFRTKLHIVAPEERKTKVFQELRRPAFSMYPQGQMFDLCTYLAYEKVVALASNPLLDHLRDDVIDKLEEFANE